MTTMDILPHIVRPVRAEGISVRVVTQVTLQVTGDNIFRVVQERVLKWLFDPARNVRSIPDGAWEGNSFTIDVDHSEHVEAIKLDSPNYWALRLSERLKDPGRIWTTEVGIAAVDARRIAFGCRLLCSERGQPETMPRSIPAFVRGIAFTQAAALDGRPLGPDPWTVKSPDDAAEFIDFLTSPTRKHPVVAFTLPDDSTSPADAAADVRQFLRRTIGYVHTAVVLPDATRILTDELGREFSVYRQAIRTYNPGFDPIHDIASDHPVATPGRIALWPQNNDAPFLDFLVNQTLRITRPRTELDQEFPPFQQIKRFAAEKAREAARASGQSDAELLALADAEIAAARKEARDNLELLEEAEREREDAISRAREIQASYAAIQQRVQHLQERLLAVDKTPPALPTMLDDLESWAREHLSGYIEIHERALKAASRSDFENVKLVFDTLILMRDHYVPMRRQGGNDLKTTFEQKLAALGLENTKCFTQKNKAKSFGDEYFVKYQGERRELDWHLKGNSSRDGRHSFRLYYFWDDDTSRVVVGYLPGHLETDIT